MSLVRFHILGSTALNPLIKAAPSWCWWLDVQVVKERKCTIKLKQNDGLETQRGSTGSWQKKKKGRSSAYEWSMETLNLSWGGGVGNWFKDNEKYVFIDKLSRRESRFPSAVRRVVTLILTWQRERNLPVHSHSLWWGKPRPSSVCWVSPLLWHGESSQRTTCREQKKKRKTKDEEKANMSGRSHCFREKISPLSTFQNFNGKQTDHSISF